jgi:DNA-binding transcriptional LysR family regulator
MRRMIGQALRRVARALLAVTLVAGQAGAGERTMVILGTATPGGGFPVFGEAFAAAINAADPTLDVQTRNTKGSAENVPLLEAGQLDIALVQGESAYEALNGVGRPPANLKIFTAMYSSPGMFVVRPIHPRGRSRISRASGSLSALQARGWSSWRAMSSMDLGSIRTRIPKRSIWSARATGLR